VCDRLERGVVVIAPDSHHMKLRKAGGQYFIVIAGGPPVNRHKPSVDVLFRSVAECAGGDVRAIMLTGMGDDGARGMKQLHDRGARTIAQNEDTCVVFGRPKEAIKHGAVDDILPIGRSATLLARPGQSSPRHARSRNMTPDDIQQSRRPVARTAATLPPSDVARLATLWTIVFVGMMGFGITIVPFPIVAEQLGASPFWVTWGSAGSFALAQMISTPLLGRLSDRVGRKPVLLLGSLGAIIGYTWTATADSLPSLLMARAFTGLASGYLAAAFAYVGDVSTPATLARRMGLLGSAFGLGFAAGPFLGGLLGRTSEGTATLLAPCLFAAGLSSLGLLGTLFALRESLAPETRASRSAEPAGKLSDHPQARKALLGVGGAMLAVTAGSAALQSIYPIWGRDAFGLPLEKIGWHFGLFSACTALSQAVLIGPMVRRFGQRRVMILAMIGSAAGLLIYGVASRVEMVWAADIVCGTSLGLFTSAATAVVSILAPPALRGAVLGLFASTSAAGRVLGPAYAGAAYALARPAPFLVGAALVAASAFAVITASRASAATDTRSTD